MGKSISDKNFFARDAKSVAQDLLGKYVCYKDGKKYKIIETEAYYHDEVDDNNKMICYGANKTKESAKRLVSAALFEKPGTWCIYGGQLLLSVTDNTYPDNVLIKRVENASKGELGQNDMALELHLYKSKDDYCFCHNRYSLDLNAPIYLMDGEDVQSIASCKRVNINNKKELRFKIDCK